MLFSNFLCLFYLMVLTRCHTISKSIASYDQLDDGIDGLNEYPFTSVFNLRHERIHPKYRRDEIGTTTALIARSTEATTKSKEKVTTSLMTTATKQRETTKTRKTTTESTKPVTAAQLDNFKVNENPEKATMNLFRRLKHKFSWRNRTAKGTTKKRKLNKKHKQTTTKVDREKRVATYMIPSTEFDQITGMFSTFKTTPKFLLGDENIMSNIKIGNIVETIDDRHYQPVSRLDSKERLPFTSPTEQFPHEMQDDDIYKGTAGIEALLNKIKMHAIDIISEQSNSVGEIITNSVTETTFDADPVLHTMTIRRYTEKPTAFDFKDVVHLADLDEDNRKVSVTSETKYNAQPENPVGAVGYNLEYKLQKEVKYALTKAKDTLTGGLNKACDQMKSVTWKFMHSTAGELNDIANKIEHSGNVKKVPAAVSENKAKITTTPTLLTKPTSTKSSKLQNFKQNLKSTTVAKPAKKPAESLINNNITTRKIRERPAAATSSNKEKDSEDESQDDYFMLKVYEKYLSHKDSAVKVLTTTPRTIVKSFQGKVSKRDTETLEHLNLKETIRKINDGEGMPDVDFNHNYRKPNTERTYSPDVELYSEGSTAKLTEATLREIASPDNSYVGLTNKIHYNEFVNGYKHYLNFARALNKFEHNFSNHVRYQAHRHHSVDDIGRFILTRLPPIPEWRNAEKYDNRRDKRAPLFEELYEENKKITPNNDNWWFKRHFNLFYDASPKKKFHTQQTVTLKAEISTETKTDKAQLLKVTKDDNRKLGEKEGLKFGWVSSKKVNKPTSTEPPKVEPKLSQPPYVSWQPEGESVISKSETTTPVALYETTDSLHTVTDVDIGALLKKIDDILGTTTDLPLSGDAKSQADADINELIKKISKSSAKLAISKIYPEHTTATASAEETTNFDLKMLQSLMSSTSVSPESEALYLNELVSALILHTPTPGNLFTVTKIEGPRHALFHKILNRAGRAASDDNEDENKEAANESDNQQLEKDTKNSNKEEFEQMKTTIPTNLFQDAALYPQQNMKFDKFGYVNLDLVAKPVTPIQKKKKNKCKKFFEKIKFKKKKIDKGKEKKGEEKLRKARHIAFKLLKNLFKASVQTESDESIYSTTEPFSYKYVDMERSLKEFMKQVPNISSEDVTSYQSSTSFSSAPTVVMNPVLAVTTSARPVTYTTLTSPAATDVRQQIKKKQYKPNNDNDLPFNFRVTPSPKTQPSPTLHVTLTPVTLDELMTELRVNMYNNKFKTNKVSFSPRPYNTRNLAENSMSTKFMPIPKVSKLKSKQYFDNIYNRDMTKLANKNYTPRNIILNNDVKRYSIQSRLTDHNKDENKIENPLGNNLKNMHDFLYEKDDKSYENQLYDVKKNSFDKDDGSSQLNSIKNAEPGYTKKDIFFDSKHDDPELSAIENKLYGIKKIQFNKEDTRFNSFKNLPNKAVEIYKNPYKSVFYKNEEKKQYDMNSIDINSYNKNMEDKTDINQLNGLVKNKAEAGKLAIQFPVLKNMRYGTTDFKLQNIENNNRDGINFQNISPLDDDDTTEGQGFRTTKRLIESYKRNKLQFRSTKIPRNYEKYKSGVQRNTIKSSIYNAKHNDDILDSICAKLHNSALVLRKSRMRENLYENNFASKPLTTTKAHISYPDYFNDFINWNQDILGLDRVTNPSIEKIVSSLMNETITTANSHQLMDEILHMQNYLKNMSLKHALTHTTAIPRHKFKMTTTKMLNSISTTKKDPKVVKRRGNSNEKTKLQSLEQLNQMVDNINKMYRKSFNKFGIPEEHTKGSVITTFSLDDVSQSPIMDTTIFAYDDSLNIIPEELKMGGYSTSTPKTIRSKIERKGALSSKTKISPPPEQYFRTPLPMQPHEFDQFLKDHDLYLPNITTPYTEISRFEENWERKHHIQSKLMDTRGKHEKFLDVPKLLKHLNQADFTPERVKIKLPELNDKISRNDINIQYKVTKTEKNTGPQRGNEYVNLDDGEYTGFYDDNIETGLKNGNTYYNIEDSIKTKRKIKPLSSVKTSSKTPFKTTNKPSSLNFDITIIDIDDIMSISKSENLEMPKISHTSLAPETTTLSPETQIPVQSVPESQMPVENVPYSKMPVQSEPETQTPEQNVPETQYVQKSTEYNSLDIDPEPENIPDSDLMSQETPENYPGQYNIPENPNNLEEENIHKNENPKYEDVDNSYKHPEDGIIYQKDVKIPIEEIRKYKPPTAQYVSSKYKPSDSVESEYYVNSLGTKVNRKLKIHKPKNQHDKNNDTPHSLHNDLLYQNFNIDQFVGTTSEQTLLPSKGPVKFFRHDPKQKLMEQTSLTKTKARDNDSESLERLPDNNREMNSHTQIEKVLNAKVRLVPKPTPRSTQKTLEAFTGEDLFAVKPSKQRVPTTVPFFSPGSKINLQQKFRKQPKRIMFSSHTMKYDVMYDDNAKMWKSYEGFTGAKLDQTKPRNNYPQMTKKAHSTDWTDGVGEDGGIDVDKILREVLGGPEGNRRRRKGNRKQRSKKIDAIFLSMWHKWRTTNVTTAASTTETTKPSEITPTRRWFKFMPTMPISKQKTRTSTPSTSSILILSSNNSTSSPILLSSAVTSQRVDAKKRGERNSDTRNGDRSRDIVYIVDVLNGNHQVQMSAVTAAAVVAEAEGSTQVPKPGDITFIYPARVVNDGGKPKITTKGETFIEPDWAKTLKPHLPHFRPYHKQTPKNEGIVKDYTLIRKLDHANPNNLPKEAENAEETSIFNVDTQGNGYQDFYVEEKREQPNPQDQPTISFPESIFITSSPTIFDASEITHYFKDSSRDTTEYGDTTTSENMLDISSLLDSKDIGPDFAENLALQTNNTKLNKDFDITKLKQEIIKLEKEMETKKILNQKQAALSTLMTDKAILDEIEAAKSKASAAAQTDTETKSTTTDKLTTTTKSMNSIAEEKQDVNEKKVMDGKEKVDYLQSAADQRKLADMEKAINENIMKENARKEPEAAVANQKDKPQHFSPASDEAKEPIKDKQSVAEQKGTKNEATVDKSADNASSKKDSKKTTTKSSKTSSATTTKVTKSKLNSKHTTHTTSATKALTQPSALTTSKNTTTTSTSTTKKDKKQKTKKTTITTVATTTTHPKTTTKLTTVKETKKAKNKNKKSKLIKRETAEGDNAIYTAKDVAALEVIVDLMKDATESTPKGKLKPVKYNENYHHLPSTNAIQVHIALPYQMEDRKRSAEPTKLRKVFSAKMSVPVDIEYQVRSLNVGDSTRKPCPKNSESCISPGMYLLVEDAKNNKGFALKPVIRQVSQDYVPSTIKTTSPKNFARVTLSKDYIQSINDQLKQLYHNLSTMDQTTKKNVKKRYAESEHLRIRRIINWDEVRKLFVSNKRVCSCKCVANQTMCKACAASDAVMTELLFEFDNMAKYMDDHCTEIQTYFWMNPSGGRKLRDMVHKIDKNINDYYKRVKGKCHGRPCNAFDKREITMPYIINEDEYLGNPLLADIEYLAQSLQEAQNLKLICSRELKSIVDRLVQITKNCTGNKRLKRSSSGEKKIYSLDNINVNIICNQDSSLQSETPSLPSSAYDLLTTEFPVFDYTDDEVTKNTRKSLKNIFVKRKNRRSHKKASKRDTVVQIESPLYVSDAQSLWREYLKDATEPTTDHAKPVITLDVLEKTDDHTIKLLIPDSATSSKTRNEILLPMANLYPKRVSGQDMFLNIDDLTTKSNKNKDIKELLKLFELNTQEYKSITGFFKERFAKATQSYKPHTTQTTTIVAGSPKEKVEIVSSVKAVTTTKATLPSKMKSYTNITSTATTPFVLMNTNPYGDVNVQDNETSTQTSQSTSNKTKESWFHKLKKIVTQGYEHTTQKPKGNDKHSQQELSNQMNVAMSENIDVISDITTTSFPTLFIIEDLPNDVNNSDYENLLIKIMEYERDKLDSELTKHKIRQKNISDKETMKILIAEQNQDSSVATPMPYTKGPSKVTELPINRQTDVAEGDYCIHKIWNKYKNAWIPQYEDEDFLNTKKTTAKQRDANNLIKMLLQSVKRSSQKAGKQSMIPPNQSSNQENQNENKLNLPTETTEINQQDHLGNTDETKTTQQELTSSISKSENTPEHAEVPNFNTVDNDAENQQTQRDKDNVNWFLAQYASTIIFTNVDYGKYSIPDNVTEKFKINKEEIYNNVPDSTTDSSYAPKDETPPATTTMAASTNFGFIKGPLAFHSKVKLVPYPKKKTTQFGLDVEYKNGNDSILSKFKPKQTSLVPDETTTSTQTSLVSEKTTPSTSSSVPTTSADKNIEVDKTTESLAPIPFTTEKHKANNKEDDEEVYAEEFESIKDKSKNNKETTNSVNKLGKNAEDNKETTTSVNKLANEAKDNKETTTSVNNITNKAEDKGEIIVTPEPSEVQPIKSEPSEAKSENDINQNNHDDNSANKPKNEIDKEKTPENLEESSKTEIDKDDETFEKVKETKPKNEMNTEQKTPEKLNEIKPKNEMNIEQKTSENLKETKTNNEMNTEQKTPENLKETKPKNLLNKEENTVAKLEETKSKNKNNQNEKSAESGLKRVLNKDISKQKKYIREACDPKTEMCLCDISATSEHIVDVRKTSPRKDFEEYIKNVTCYAYKKPPPYFLIEPWKRKVRKRKHQKQRRFNRYFDSVPLKKNLKWDWIRRKRSLLSVRDDDDNFGPEETSYHTNNELHPHSNNVKEEPKTITNNYKVLDTDIDDFESLYKGHDNVYRAIKKRLKRTAGDMKELAHGLRNLPPLQSRQDELYAMLGDKVSLDCVHASRYHKSAQPVSWDAERPDMLASPDVVVKGPAVIIKRVEARNSGNYTCNQNGKTRNVRLTVVTVPQFHVVFIPMYSSKQGCSYDDLRAMKHLGPLISRESCSYSQKCNSVQIDEPICMEDKDDGSIHLRATEILTACPHPEVKCSAQCRRNLQCAFALFCAANAPVLHGVKVVVARQAYNKTLIPSHGNNRRLIVTHTLRKKDLQKHLEYHQLAASMLPGNLDIVVSCPAGYYLIRKQKICAACPADTYAAAGENTCYACAPGTSSEPGAARCKLSIRRMRSGGGTRLVVTLWLQLACCAHALCAPFARWCRT